MANQLELAASIYVDEEGARTILDELHEMSQTYTYTGMADAARCARR